MKTTVITDVFACLPVYTTLMTYINTELQRAFPQSPDSLLTAHVSQRPSCSGNMVFSRVHDSGVLGKCPKLLALDVLAS
jgi:hypothetical protein